MWHSVLLSEPRLLAAQVDEWLAIAEQNLGIGLNVEASARSAIP